jgi:hypothetical protein
MLCLIEKKNMEIFYHIWNGFCSSKNSQFFIINCGQNIAED